MRPVEHVVVVRCAAPRLAVWPYLANTELLNMYIGSRPLDVERTSEEDSATRFIITTKVGGITLRYREEPWQWAETRFFSFKRLIESGPGRSVSVRYDLADEPDGGTLMTLRATLVPRHWLFWPIVWFISRGEFARVGKFVEAIDQSIASKTPLRPVRESVDEARADRCIAALGDKYPAELKARFRDHICHGADYQVLRMRPFELAREWNEPRDEIVRLCLDAVNVGLLELNWCVICPSCQNTSERLPSLSQLTESGHCHACDLGFGIDLVRLVEATFSPHATIRVVVDRPFCIAGPMLTPHVMAQGVVYPGASTVLDVADEAGRYRLFGRGGASAIVDAGVDKPQRARVTLTRAAADGAGDASSSFAPAEIDVAPGGQIEVDSLDAEPCHVKLERTNWTFDALTALHVSAMPEFRAQFGGESLRPGLALKVGRVAVYFSDLCGSTALYSKLGDAAAFGVVTDCLEYGSAIVQRHGGVVVKTMGDAIMATFLDVDAALRAGADSVIEWKKFQKEHPLASDLEIKVGVAAGPCTIVTANGVLDYFGQTVNSAARIQHLAGAGEFVAPQDLAADTPAGLREIERFDAHVKGIVAALSLVRFGVGGG